MRWTQHLFTPLLVLLLTGCSLTQASGKPAATHSAPAEPTALATVAQPTSTLAAAAGVIPTVAPTGVSEPAGAPEPVATLPSSGGTPAVASISADDWQKSPVIPTISKTVLQIYQRGLELGNNPHAFSKVGDCGSTPAWFLGDFDRGSKFYQLGPYQSLAAVIQQFAGSYNRTSLAAGRGFNTSSVFTTLWADRTQCVSGETPLACEYRLNRPSFAFVMLGTNDVYHKDVFETQMRKIIEFSIQNGVIPILSTKADNLEGDDSINLTIARLATEYDLPLWNYWLASRSLPDYGLQEDKAHITWGPNRFDDPQALTRGWTMRNLTALQALDAAWRATAGAQ